jgi:hypothetical protein
MARLSSGLLDAWQRKPIRAGQGDEAFGQIDESGHVMQDRSIGSNSLAAWDKRHLVQTCCEDT